LKKESAFLSAEDFDELSNSPSKGTFSDFLAPERLISTPSPESTLLIRLFRVVLLLLLCHPKGL
jgi:hypothetical protein